MSVYLIEDSAVTRAQLEAALRGAGEEVRAFDCAEAALAAIGERAPRLIVTDVMLPGVSGIELLQAVRSRHRRLELPVIVVSSLDHLDDVARAYEAGADDYLTKPVDPAELVKKARLLLRRGDRGALEPETPTWTRYERLDRLGHGQSAAIWRARRIADGRELAMKVLEAGAAPRAVGALLAEAELLRSLPDVPGIPRVRDAGSEGGATYYAMDLVMGETLAARLERQGDLPVSEAAAICRAVAATLGALAEAEVVHGDLKPENLILSPEGPVLVDFGLARKVGGAGRERRGGTLAYLAPEVLRGGESTAQSDLYSLGTILFEALAGRLPYGGQGSEVAAQKVEGAAPDLSALIEADVPPGVIAIVEEALEPDPGRRTARATQVALALLPYVSLD